MRLKTRVITSVVGLGVLALVLCFFDTLVFNVALAAVVLIALHEIYSAFALKCPAVYAGLVPITLFVFCAAKMRPTNFSSGHFCMPQCCS